MRSVAAMLMMAFAHAALGHDGGSASAAARMREAADAVLTTLPASARAQVARPFDDRDRLDWHYVPRNRNGVALKALDDRSRNAVHALLRSALSEVGYRKIVNIIELELVLRELETFGAMRDPERYHLTIYGAPSPSQPWGWRFEGHHLSLNFTFAGDRFVVDTPSFLGANPAKVAGGPRSGLRVLASEEDLARALLESLSEAQRRIAVFDARTYGDIVTTNAASVDPLQPVGIAAGELDASQRARLLALVETYAATFEPSLAQARMARARLRGQDEIRFGWAGSTAPGRPHYYRVQGPAFLIEYDASQNGGNHVHTVWRDFSGDFGRDLLREHYRMARGTSHRH